MSDSLFKEGGPHRIRRSSGDEYEMSVPIPLDEDGMLSRECVHDSCSPAYFKVRPGTGITEAQDLSYCPYCRAEANPAEFHTRDQIRYATDIAMDEASRGFDDMFRKSLGIGASGKRNLVDGPISMDLEYKPARRRPVQRPADEELRRDITCGECSLEHAVFGLAMWCPDCGTDIFMQHVAAEFAVVKSILNEVPQRRARLGARVAARDLENSLEDVVSIFEAVLKIITRHTLMEQGWSDEDVKQALRKRVRNAYQSISRAQVVFRELIGRELFSSIPEADVQRLAKSFEKRHPITHNLGVVDRKYLDKVRSGELEGREVRINVDEVMDALGTAMQALAAAYAGSPSS